MSRRSGSASSSSRAAHLACRQAAGAGQGVGVRRDGRQRGAAQLALPGGLGGGVRCASRPAAVGAAAEADVVRGRAAAKRLPLCHKTQLGICGRGGERMAAGRQAWEAGGSSGAATGTGARLRRGEPPPRCSDAPEMALLALQPWAASPRALATRSGRTSQDLQGGRGQRAGAQWRVGGMPPLQADPSTLPAPPRQYQQAHRCAHRAPSPLFCLLSPFPLPHLYDLGCAPPPLQSTATMPAGKQAAQRCWQGISIARRRRRRRCAAPFTRCRGTPCDRAGPVTTTPGPVGCSTAAPAPSMWQKLSLSRWRVASRVGM